ncbi:MAG: hypothetical protein C0626_06590 [Arcobacter sp.]|uniref:hypothetical protein n=1 Tax=uncultured Arcobacter sp. TaxID=165434 RepID=UPI000CBDD64D|nr:hypothetical protein [uncultured Arcobacter sp.]PLY10120.1 MAG: hypothetical protein C0626_06590 [Arcobacter sp.]
MKKELIIFLFILIILSLFSHFDKFITHPISHIQSLPQSTAYGLGFLHPILITLVVYLLLYLPRFIIKFIKNKS